MRLPCRRAESIGGNGGPCSCGKSRPTSIVYPNQPTRIGETGSSKKQSIIRTLKLVPKEHILKGIVITGKETKKREKLLSLELPIIYLEETNMGFLGHSSSQYMNQTKQAIVALKLKPRHRECIIKHLQQRTLSQLKNIYIAAIYPFKRNRVTLRRSHNSLKLKPRRYQQSI